MKEGKKVKPNGGLHIKWLLAVLGLSLMPVTSALTVDNIRFHGALVAEPCVIPPGAEIIQLDFGTVLDKYLYINTRTHGQKFELSLINCDISLGNSVKVTFLGEESSALPGLLALSSSSQAAGVAIGIETSKGELLPVNQASKGNRLVDGNSSIKLQAYVQAEPEAIAHKNIQRGSFNSIATFRS
ncbi:fimbrial protein [Serratia fonticola]|uniref:fimbrial protein n=1 Tax=Serratia fonticola TaxID=47917 RepID=UPI003AF35515